MDYVSPSERKAQLDKAEREHLEDVVAGMRDRVEDNVEFQLTQQELGSKPDDRDSVDEETEQLVEAIELEAVDGESWSEAFEQYVTGVGYTIVNRLAALRCMEVRNFLDEEVTVFKENDLTPAAETLVHEEFLLEDEAILQAYHDACDDLAEEIEILFDRETAYSLIDPDDDTFEELCGMLDEVLDEVWRADDVLGWVYEYYNQPVVEALDAKNTLEPEDVGPANQFYTPHWVVRMLTDNSLGKLYLEATDQQDAIPDPESLAPEERKDRLVTPEDSPSVAELCTYLIPDEKPGDAPEFDHPRELRVIDPACGSGHFLLYAFDVLERIWWAETDLDRAAIPAEVLEHNLYGVDIDLRSCQLSAFNLYLKARTRGEAENGEFEMPNLGIVAADARVAEVEEAVDVLDEITGEGSDLREALDDVIETFQHTEALGSLLDVSGTIEEAFDASKTQSELTDYNEGAHQSLNSFLKALRRAVEAQTSDSFGEQNLRSFLHLLVVLTQEYDVSLMNPPYGMRGRMPDAVQKHVEENYEYYPEYYISFFEACERLARPSGRIGMLIPWSFMFRKVFESFREDFVNDNRDFDFLADFGYDILDNATVGTVGTVFRVGTVGNEEGTFIRLHDVRKGNKEREFINTAFFNAFDGDIQRRFTRDTSEFSMIPGASISYWVPEDLRELYTADTVIDTNNAGLPDRDSIGVANQGIATGNNGRFLRKFWETESGGWEPFMMGGKDAWALPRNNRQIIWEADGQEVRRFSGGNGTPNEDYYFTEGIIYNKIKRSGRNFGYMHPHSIFSHAGMPIFPDEMSAWPLIAYLNSRLVTYLKLAQTFERKWEVSTVARLPVIDPVFDNQRELADAAKEQVANVVSKRSLEFTSPHFSGTILAQMVGYDREHSWTHPHRTLLEDVPWTRPEEVPPDSSIEEMADIAEQHIGQINDNLERISDKTDEILFDAVDLTEEERTHVRLEVGLRTTDDPANMGGSDEEGIADQFIAVESLIKDFLLQIAIEITKSDADGIVPLSDIDGEDDLLSRVEAEFKRVFGQHADARLAEVDDVLGSQSADEEAYPNLRAWLEDDLFEYHVSKFDRTPILWRLTTERLVSDSKGEGFACLVDYHQLDEGAFDRLQNRYLEPRKSLLRERRSATNRRRNDASLPTSEQADAAEEYARCESGLEQIAAFEDRLADLAQPAPREWSSEDQQTAETTADRIAEFRDRTEDRLGMIDELAAMEDVDLAELFTGNFFGKIEDNREEWIDALYDLKAAFDAYAADSDQPVEAHLYDLFDYYTEDLLGSSHFASNGILYMTYYFEKLELADQARLDDAGVSRKRRLISQLASDLDEYIELGDSIAEDCKEVSSGISSEWADRALSEITTAGYRPNHKHGVEINIAPLADAEIVPKIVEEKVL